MKETEKVISRQEMTEELPLERHPWPPFIPAGARVLIMGTFPPGAHRWGMDFYYPNRTNDFWPMMGLIFRGDKEAFYKRATRSFDVEAIKELLSEKGIAMNDTGRVVRRLKGNASDKYLEIVEPVPLMELLEQMPDCRAIATTGEKAAQVIAELTSTQVPAIGESVEGPGGIRIWRMPSTSRAYPLALEKKAIPYEKMFRESGVL